MDDSKVRLGEVVPRKLTAEQREDILRQLQYIKDGVERLALLQRLLAHYAALMDAAVVAAIDQGRGWPEIAEVLGVTRQAVHKRFKRRLGL